MRGLKRLAMARSVMVNLTTGKAFSGILWDQHGDIVVLRNVTLYEKDAEPVDVPGEVLLDRAKIEFVQAVS